MFIHDLVPRMTCRSPASKMRPHPFVGQLAGNASSQSNQLGKRFSDQWIPFEGAKPPREPKLCSYLLPYVTLTY